MPENVKILVFKGKKRLELAQKAVPTPGEDEVLLDVAVSAFCGSEKEAWAFEEGVSVNPGHEFTGIISKSPDPRFRPGEPVSVHVTAGCGNCYYCRMGMQQFCKGMKIIDGGHAAKVTVPAKACLPIPDGMTHEEAVLLYGDTIGVGYRAIKQICQDKNTPVLVLGAGPIGLGTLALLKHFGYRAAVSEPGEYRRTYVREQDLAEWVLDPTETDLEEFLAPLTDEVGPATVIECTGNRQAVNQAVELVRCGGKVILAGVSEKPLELTAAQFIFKELTVCGVWYQSDQDIEELTQIWREGFDPLPLISHRCKAKDAAWLGNEFFEGRTAKAVVHWNES